MKFVYNIIKKKQKAKAKTFSEAENRRICGIFCSCFGIILNLLLCVFKLTAGAVCSSSAAVADAVHSLADSISGVAVLLGFAVSKYKYAETAASLAVCFLLVYGGIKNASGALFHIVSPEKTEFSFFGALLLAVSLFVKMYLSVFNRNAAKMLNSKALKASFADSLCDTLSTSASLFAVVAAAFTDANIDAYCTLAVSLIMITAGLITAFRKE